VEVAATARSFGGEGDDAAMGRGKLAPPNTRSFELMQHPRNPLLGPKQVHASTTNPFIAALKPESSDSQLLRRNMGSWLSGGAHSQLEVPLRGDLTTCRFN
jgi:hypothetical protein